MFVGLACKRGTFQADRTLSVVLGLAEWGFGAFLALTMRICEQGPALAEVSSLFSCVYKRLFASSARGHFTQVCTSAPESFLVGIGAG